MKNAMYILIIIIFISCGARKSDKKRSEESTNIAFADKSKSNIAEEKELKTESNIKSSVETKVDDQDQTVTVKETLEPADITKPATYKDKDGKLQELNNTKKTTETTIKKNNTKTEQLQKLEEVKKDEEKSNKTESNYKNIKAKADIKKDDEVIHVEREAYSLWNFLWIIIPLGIAYWCWHKYKKVT